MSARLLFPIPGIILAGTLAELVVGGSAALLASSPSDSNLVLLSILSGLTAAIPIVTGVALWLIKDHLALKAWSERMHAENVGVIAQNNRKLDHLIELVEGPDGLLEERRLSRKSREGIGRVLADVVTHVRAIERHLERCGEETGQRFMPPPTEELPHRRRGDDS